MENLIKTISLFLKLQIGIGTTFWGNGDVYNPNPKLYCTNKIMDDGQLIAAHPYLKCGSKAMVYNIRTKKSVVVTIQDRGPRKAKIDLSIGASKAIKLNGKEMVMIFPF